MEAQQALCGNPTVAAAAYKPGGSHEARMRATAVTLRNAATAHPLGVPSPYSHLCGQVEGGTSLYLLTVHHRLIDRHRGRGCRPHRRPTFVHARLGEHVSTDCRYSLHSRKRKLNEAMSAAPTTPPMQAKLVRRCPLVMRHVGPSGARGLPWVDLSEGYDVRAALRNASSDPLGSASGRCLCVFFAGCC